MKYKRLLCFLYPLVLLIPAVSRAARETISAISNPIPFPAAILAAGFLVFRFDLRRLLAALEIVLLLYLPLLSNIPYPIPSRFCEEDALRLCRQLSVDAEKYAFSAPPAFAEVADECLSLTGGVIKAARFPEWMRLTRTAGVFIPLTGEAILNPNEPAFSLPFLALHEIAHQSGLMNEGQASVRAYLWAMSSQSEAFRYSASVEALRRAVSLLNGLDPNEAARFVQTLSGRVQRDLFALGALSAESTGRFTRLAGDYCDLARYLLAFVNGAIA